MGLLIEIGLNGQTPGANTYDVYLSDCGTTSWVQIRTGITFDQFPVVANGSDYNLNGSLKYQVISDNGCSCEGCPSEGISVLYGWNDIDNNFTNFTSVSTTYNEMVEILCNGDNSYLGNNGSYGVQKFDTNISTGDYVVSRQSCSLYRNRVLFIKDGLTTLPGTYLRTDGDGKIVEYTRIEVCPTATPIPPTDTPIPTPTPTPTQIVLSPTNTPLPTATDTPLPTATDTPLPTATETPVPTATDIPPTPTPTVELNEPTPQGTFMTISDDNVAYVSQATNISLSSYPQKDVQYEGWSWLNVESGYEENYTKYYEIYDSNLNALPPTNIEVGNRIRGVHGSGDYFFSASSGIHLSFVWTDGNGDTYVIGVSEVSESFTYNGSPYTVTSLDVTSKTLMSDLTLPSGYTFYLHPLLVINGQSWPTYNERLGRVQPYDYPEISNADSSAGYTTVASGDQGTSDIMIFATHPKPQLNTVVPSLSPSNTISFITNFAIGTDTSVNVDQYYRVHIYHTEYDGVNSADAISHASTTLIGTTDTIEIWVGSPSGIERTVTFTPSTTIDLTNKRLVFRYELYQLDNGNNYVTSDYTSNVRIRSGKRVSATNNTLTRITISGSFVTPPTPTATSVPPTSTPVPTATDTPVPTPTDTPVPTSTPLPTASSTPIPLPTSTPVPLDVQSFYADNGSYYSFWGSACNSSTTTYQLHHDNLGSGSDLIDPLPNVGDTIYSTYNNGVLSNPINAYNIYVAVTDTNGGSPIAAVKVNNSGVVVEVVPCPTPTPTEVPPTSTPLPTPTPTVFPPSGWYEFNVNGTSTGATRLSSPDCTPTSLYFKLYHRQDSTQTTNPLPLPNLNDILYVYPDAQSYNVWNGFNMWIAISSNNNTTETNVRVDSSGKVVQIQYPPC